MIIKLKGEFNKKEFINTLSEQLDLYIEDDWSAYGSLYLNFNDENGTAVDWHDKRDNSLKVEIQGRKKKRLSVKDVEMVVQLLKKGRSAEEISKILEIADSEIKKSLSSINESGLLDELPLLKEAELDTYMFLESEVNLDKNKYKDYIKEIGVLRTENRKYEKVYTIKDLCIKENMNFIRNIMETDEPFVVKESFLEYNCAHLLPMAERKGYTILRKEIVEYYDLKELLQKSDYNFFDNRYNLQEGYEAENVKHLTKAQIDGEEIGYTVNRWYLLKQVVPIYSTEKLYKKYNINLLSEEEILKESGISLFNPHAIHNYYPTPYGVRRQLEPYGFDKNGKAFHKLKRTLHEIFGLIKNSDLSQKDFTIHPKKIKKLTMILKENNLDLGDIFPDGMTDDYKFVYKEGKIPEHIITEHNEYWEQRKLKEELSKIKNNVLT